MRLIDADRFIDMIVNERMPWTTKTIGEVLSQVPTVDAEPVVRCKDCRYCTTNTTVMTTQTLVHCNAHRIMTEWDGYCYKGERRC